MPAYCLKAYDNVTVSVYLRKKALQEKQDMAP